MEACWPADIPRRRHSVKRRFPSSGKGLGPRLTSGRHLLSRASGNDRRPKVRALRVPAILAVSLSLAVGQETPPKISPELLEQAKTKTVLPVLILLTDQPQGEILERARGASEWRLQSAEVAYSRVASQESAPAWQVTEARDSLDAVVLETRQAAFREIESAIRFQQDSVAAHLSGLGARIVHRYTGINMLGVFLPSTALQLIAANPDVARIVLAGDLHPQLNISVPALGAPSFWNAGFTGAGQSVAVLDTGIKTDHPAFAGKDIVSHVFLDAGSQSSCFNDSVNSATDNDGHGTFVAGVIASIGPPGFESYQGVAKGLSRIYNLKVAYRVQASAACQNAGNTNLMDLFSALDWITRSTPVSILNYSYGFTAPQGDDVPAQLVDDYTGRYGLSFVTAAGNSGPAQRTLTSPAIGYNVISVAAWDDRGTVAAFSSRGPTVRGVLKPDITAPGVNINSADFQSNQFIRQSGTSVAAPFVTGTLALLHQAGITNSLVGKALLLNTTDAPGWSSDTGWGYANLNHLQSSLNSFTGTVASTTRSGNYLFYVGKTAGAFRATLTWSRHIAFTTPVTSTLNPIGLYLYDRSTSNLLVKSERWSDNVQQVATTTSGNVVLKVKSSSAAGAWASPSEDFAVALSDAGFVPAVGPSLRINCTAPPSVSPNTAVAVNCTAANSGDLEANSVSASFTGTLAPSPMQFGLLTAGASIPRTATVTSPGTSGTYTVQATLTGTAFGDSFSASSSCSITVAPSGALAISTSATLPQATAGTPYNQTLVATGGAAPYTWSITSGSLPAGLNLSASGVISGTPSASGTSNFTVQVTDSTSSTASRAFS